METLCGDFAIFFDDDAIPGAGFDAAVDFAEVSALGIATWVEPA